MWPLSGLYGVMGMGIYIIFHIAHKMFITIITVLLKAYRTCKIACACIWKILNVDLNFNNST